MNFKNEYHKENYRKLIEKDQVGDGDVYRKSFFYLMALSENLCNHVHELYDFKKHQLIIDVENPFDGQGWHTGSSRRILPLALNLYNNGCVADVTEVFAGCSDPEYLFEAIRIRFEMA